MNNVRFSFRNRKLASFMALSEAIKLDRACLDVLDV